MLTGSQIDAICGLPVPVLTVYLNTGSSEPPYRPLVPASLAWLKEAAKSFEASLPTTERGPYREQVDRVEEFFDGRHPHERGLAIFSGREAWQLVPLQIGVENDLRWGSPAVSQLLWFMDEHKPYCMVVVDRKGVRFLRYQLRELSEIQQKKFTVDVSQWKTKELGHVTGQNVHKTRGSQRDVFDRRVEAQYARLCRETARQAATICEKYECRAIFLVGGDHLVGCIETAIPRELRRRVALVEEDLGRSPLLELQKHLVPEIEKWERQHQKTLVDDLLTSDRGTIKEPDETLAKLQQGKVRVIVVVRDLNFDLRQCVGCGWTDRSADPVCPKCRGTRSVAALHDVLPTLARKHEVALEIVSGDAAKRLREAGGLGGWLRAFKHAASR